MSMSCCALGIMICCVCCILGRRWLSFSSTIPSLEFIMTICACKVLYLRSACSTCPIKSNHTLFVQVLYKFVRNIYRICSDLYFETIIYIYILKELYGICLNLYSILFCTKLLLEFVRNVYRIYLNLYSIFILYNLEIYLEIVQKL